MPLALAKCTPRDSSGASYLYLYMSVLSPVQMRVIYSLVHATSPSKDCQGKQARGPVPNAGTVQHVPICVCTEEGQLEW